MTTAQDTEEHTLYRYKYLPFTEGSLKMITEGTLKFTCPLDFNDPFDCVPGYDPLSIDNIPLSRPDLIERVAVYHGLSLEEAAKLGVENAHKGVSSGDFSRGLIENLGVCSLSKIATNILMWSHYADHHKGFVVELRISTEAPYDLLVPIMPFPVEYQEDRPFIDWAKKGDVVKYFLTKSSDWKYEEEERILTTSEGPGIHAYSRSHFLCSVIAGAKISKADLAHLESIVKSAGKEIGKDIPLYKAELAQDKYRIHVPGHSRS